MKGIKILVVIAALVVVAGMTTDAWAQCTSARFMASSGAGGANYRANVTGVDNGTATIGRFWDSDNANFSNNGLTDVVGDGSGFGSLCTPKHPVDGWWDAHGTSGVEQKIDGFLTSGACAQFGCPASRMTVVVEDYATGGPPGVGQTAYYIAWLVDETPVATRWYDYSKVNGNTAAGTFPMAQFPDVAVTGSSRSGSIVTVNYNNLDQSGNIFTWNNVAGATFPATDAVTEWQLVKYTGTGDPGRLRSLGWVTIQTTPYVPGGGPANFNVPCTNETDDEYLAIGIGFNGGLAGVIDSALVGKAIQLECDPNLAQPEGPINIDKKPSATQLESKPGRSGGRR